MTDTDWPDDWQDIPLERAKKYLKDHDGGGGDETIMERCQMRVDVANNPVRRTDAQPPVERGEKRP